VLLLHGNNFGGFYFGAVIEALTNAGFRVVVPDQIGYGRSSKPVAPYNLNSQARNTYLILQAEKIERVMVVGHSMGGMLAARFTTQYPKAVERLVIYNPIGLADRRAVSADIEDRLPEHPGEPGPLRRSQPESVERRIRGLRAHPLLVDAQRRVAEAGHGTGADQPDALR
jgi:pimeloyl-ACP methyl ester carboxylesterase